MEQSVEMKNKESYQLKATDKVYHFCIGLLPVLCLLNFPILNISFGTVLLVAFIPHSMLFLLKNQKTDNYIGVIPFLLLYVYLIVRSDANMASIFLSIAALINIWGMLKGSIKTKEIRRIIEIYALVNVALVLLQTLVYYSFHYKIHYIPRFLVHSQFQESYAFRDEPGLYRPSALFLEPSHFSQYCCFALISVLFPAEEGKADLKTAFAIAVGCVLTTSGMGIALTAGIFGWYIMLCDVKKGSKIVPFLKWLPVLAIAVVVLLQIPFFQSALQRVFTEEEGYNAISGRTKQWSKAIGPMSGGTLLFGYGGSADYPFYLNGLADTIYKYGIVGVALEGFCFLYLMLKKVANFTWCCCISFIILFCVAHLTSYFTQVFYYGIVIADAVSGHDKRKTRITGILRQ